MLMLMLLLLLSYAWCRHFLLLGGAMMFYDQVVAWYPSVRTRVVGGRLGGEYIS